MTNSSIQITPVTFQATELILSVEYQLNQKAIIHYQLKSERGILFDNGAIILTPEEFNGWGFDDSYIENLVLSRLGLTRV